ncbi:MAG: hypothetical protein V3S47_02615, partial [Acidobacteriota bacterium]
MPNPLDEIQAAGNGSGIDGLLASVYSDQLSTPATRKESQPSIAAEAMGAAADRLHDPETQRLISSIYDAPYRPSSPLGYDVPPPAESFEDLQRRMGRWSEIGRRLPPIAGQWLDIGRTPQPTDDPGTVALLRAREDATRKALEDEYLQQQSVAGMHEAQFPGDPNARLPPATEAEVAGFRRLRERETAGAWQLGNPLKQALQAFGPLQKLKYVGRTPERIQAAKLYEDIVEKELAFRLKHG